MERDRLGNLSANWKEMSKYMLKCKFLRLWTGLYRPKMGPLVSPCDQGKEFWIP